MRGLLLYLLTIVVLRAVAVAGNYNTTAIFTKENSNRITYLLNSTTDREVQILGKTNLSVDCSFKMDTTEVLRNKKIQQKCCHDVFDFFRRKWMLASVNLSDLLRALRDWKCPKFESECSGPTFDFTEFNKLTYSRFCNESEFRIKCEGEILHIISHNSIHDPSLNLSAEKHISKVTRNESDFQEDPLTYPSSLRRAKLSLDQMLIPCVQAGLIETNSRNSSGYFEIKETMIPMCEIVWCGFTNDAFVEHTISEWICLPARCQVNIIVIMVTSVILGICITISNALVLVIFARNKKLRDSQGIYKISLAIADLFVGCFLVLTIPETLRRAYQTTFSLAPIDHNISSWENNWNGTRLSKRSFTDAYLGLVGFVTTLSLSVSVYTLMTASFDRFLVVFRPMRYNTYTAKAVAIKLVLTLWLIAIIFATIPFMVPYLFYEQLSSMLTLFHGEGEFAIYLAAFFIPLILVWVVNIATFLFSRKNAKVRPKIRGPDSKIRSVNIENQLFKTLAVMVAVFTVSLLPVVAVVFMHLFLSGINTSRPSQLDPGRLVVLSSAELIQGFILLSNSLWNFFIYHARSHEFRITCKRQFVRFKAKLRSRIVRNSAKEARRRRTSAAALQYSSQVHSLNVSAITPG